MLVVVVVVDVSCLVWFGLEEEQQLVVVVVEEVVHMMTLQCWE